MTPENLVRLLQMTGAALAIPAAAAGTFAAYQSYFSSDVTCQKLRNNIVAIMERHVAPETKRSLLKKDVTEFDKFCGEGDPDARAIFQAAITEDPGDAAHAPAAAPAHVDSSPQRQQTASLGVFGAPGSKEHYGWVALSRRQAGSWVPHFNGYSTSDTSLPPPGTILSAKNDAAGLVGTAGRNERSGQAAEQAADGRLRARARNSRRGRAAVGRGRPGIMLVSKGCARVRMLDPG
jgi:hypothetical protein